MSSDTSPRSTNSSQSGIQVVARVAQILRALDNESQGLSLSQLAKRVGLPRSSTHRIVSALTAEGLLAAASPNGRVLLGPEISRLAAGRREFWRELRPYMERLFYTLSETVDCSILDGDHVRFVDQIAGSHRLRAVSVVGSSFPLHSTANGKAILAELGSDELARLLPGRLKRYTEHTITSPTALMRELEEIRERGVAFDREEHTIGISAAGVALRDPSGDFAALTVPMPTQRFVVAENEVARAMLEVRRDVESTFGFTGS
jgi:IclR family transcriptional regulator, acetate operon repressor